MQCQACFRTIARYRCVSGSCISRFTTGSGSGMLRGLFATARRNDRSHVRSVVGKLKYSFVNQLSRASDGLWSNHRLFDKRHDGCCSITTAPTPPTWTRLPKVNMGVSYIWPLLACLVQPSSVQPSPAQAVQSSPVQSIQSSPV